MATVRCCGSRNMLRIKDRVDGASVAPATPSSARVAISISVVVENAAITEATPNAAAANQEKPAAADAIAQRAHRDQRSGDQEAVDVHDPQELRAAGLQRRTQLGHRQVQDRQVHGVEQARQGDDGESDPLAACSLWTSQGYLSSRTDSTAASTSFTGKLRIVKVAGASNRFIGEPLPSPP